MKKTSAFALSLSGLALFYGLAYSALFLASPLFPDPGLRDKEFDQGTIVDLCCYSDGGWSKETVDGKTVFTSPEIEEKVAKLAYVDCPAEAEVKAYVGEEEVLSGEVAAEDGYYMFRFPFSYTYIDRVSFLFENVPEGEFDLCVAKVVRAA